MSGAVELEARITSYLSLGGLFNPEMANHDAVRDLLIDCRAELATLRADNERLGRELTKCENMHLPEATSAALIGHMNCMKAFDEMQKQKFAAEAVLATPAPALTNTKRGALRMATLTPITTVLFWSKVAVPSSRVDCWEWRSTLNDSGYGRFWSAGKWIAAHRFAYEALKGEIPTGLHVRHMCHNRLCCNPDHLDVGTAKENVADSVRDDRIVRGSNTYNSKLNEAAVVAIRQNADRLRTKDLAERYGVSAGTISNIRSGKIWRHVAA